MLWRAEQVPTVLAPPSLTDGTLELEELLRRVRTRRLESFTPNDLALALLRLRPDPDHDLARGSAAWTA